MKKVFKFYCVIWFAALALFNVISFVSVGWTGQEKYTSSFWIGYIFIIVAFIGQFACSFVALKENNLQKLFYKFSLLKLSYTGLILTFLVGGLCMLISWLPYWVGAIACAIILCANIISVMKASVAIEAVSATDDKIKSSTAFIRMLTSDAQSLVARAKSNEAKTVCTKVYEAIRYSDPMSDEALGGVENQITNEFMKLSDAVKSGDDDKASQIAEEVIQLVDERNNKCKVLK